MNQKITLGSLGADLIARYAEGKTTPAETAVLSRMCAQYPELAATVVRARPEEPSPSLEYRFPLLERICHQPLPSTAVARTVSAPFPYPTLEVEEQGVRVRVFWDDQRHTLALNVSLENPALVGVPLQVEVETNQSPGQNEWHGEWIFTVLGETWEPEPIAWHDAAGNLVSLPSTLRFAVGVYSAEEVGNVESV